MHSEKTIRVYYDEAPVSARPFEVVLRNDMSLNNFRRECSKVAGVDVISMFASDSRRISDTSDLANVSEIIISRHFYLRTEWTPPSSPLLLKGTTIKMSPENRSTKAPIVAQVEIIALPNTGKTTFIQRFLQHDGLATQASQVTEAVYHQKLDIHDRIVEFVLTDVIEDKTPPVINERVYNRDVILFGISKQTLLDQINANTLADTWAWIHASLDLIGKASPKAMTALVLFKYDVICDSENVITERLRELPDHLKVMKVSAREGMAVADVMDPHQLFTIVGTHLIKRSAGAKNRGVREKAVEGSPLSMSMIQNGSQMSLPLGGAYMCIRSFLG